MKMIKVDDIIEFCDTERTMLHAHGNSVACAALRRVTEFAKEYAVEVEPVKHGRWEIGGVCSKCGFMADDFSIKWVDYCPNCGARMDGDSDVQ